MPHFSDEADVYAQLGAMLREVVADERIGARLQGADTVFQCRLRAPDARLTVKARAAEERVVDLGETTLQPELVLTMDADVAHRFWLGELNPAVALANGEIQVRGPVAKLLKLIPIAIPAAARYRELLESGALAATAAEEPAAEEPAAEEPAAEEPAAEEPAAEEPAVAQGPPDAPPAEPEPDVDAAPDDEGSDETS